MANLRSWNRLQDLWVKIDSLHLKYLQTDESLEKLELRRRLEGYIREYLCLVPHNQKFSFRETAEVLRLSASTKKNFSGYRAAAAWDALGTYASNLLTQPWRKEYRDLKMYSGFYKHEVDEKLAGAQVMLEAMGYERRGSAMVLDGPIDPDRVSGVSRDCLAAFVECQLLRTIWEEVSCRFPCSWLEVLEFREQHVGFPEVAARSMVYRHHQRQWQQQMALCTCAPYFSCPPPMYAPQNNGCVCSVPTGRLIELDNLPPACAASTSSESPAPHCWPRHALDGWDYVYRNLQDQGYTKDLGERGNLLDHLLREDDVEEEDEEQEEDDYDEEDEEENAPQQDVPPTQTRTSKHPGEPKLAKDPPHGADRFQTPNATRAAETPRRSLRWECVTCTFLNPTTRDVCDMCGKSRTRGPEAEPLASGGRECPNCTLVNERGAETCEACGSSLKGSPTYI